MQCFCVLEKFYIFIQNYFTNDGKLKSGNISGISKQTENR